MLNFIFDENEKKDCNNLFKFVTLFESKHILESIFIDYPISFHSSNDLDKIDKWYYPVILANLIYLNSLIDYPSSIGRRRDILKVIPDHVKEGIRNKKGKILLIILEPIADFIQFSAFASEYKDVAFLTLHYSPEQNFFYTTLYDLFSNRNLKHGKPQTITYGDDYNVTNMIKRRYSCFLFNYHEHHERLMLVSFLEKRNLLDEGYLSMKNKGMNFDKILKSIPKHDFLKKDLTFKSYDKVFDGLDIHSTFKNTLFNICVEGEIAWQGYPNVTEKVFKCVIGRSPFILLSHYRALAGFKSLGFKTFDSLIDESYDTIECPEHRIKLVLNEIDKLCTMPIEKLEEKVVKLKNVLDYNYDHYHKLVYLQHKKLHEFLNE